MVDSESDILEKLVKSGTLTSETTVYLSLAVRSQDLLSAPLKVLSIKELLLRYSSSLTFPPSQRSLLLIPFPCMLQSLYPMLLFSCSVMSDSATPWTAACQVSLSFTISWSLLRHMSIELVMPFNHLILCNPLLLLPSIFPRISVFSNESALHIRWPKYWSFSFSISPSNEDSGLISFRIDWFHLLAVQGTHKSLLQYYNLKASILQHSAFYMVELPHLYMSTGKTIALTIWTFVSMVMSMLFNMLSRFVIAFLPRSMSLFISW